MGHPEYVQEMIADVYRDLAEDLTIRDALTDVWLKSLDRNHETWHLSVWAPIVHEIGRALEEHAPDHLRDRLEAKLAGS